MNKNEKAELSKFIDATSKSWEKQGLGQLISQLQEITKESNRSLAKKAGVSEGAIRNLLKCGEDPKAKGPDARTLYQVANALGTDATIFFRLAGYIPPKEPGNSARSQYLARVFDQLSPEKQEAIMGVFEAMVSTSTDKTVIQKMRSDPDNPISGLDIVSLDVMRVLANKIINIYQMVEPSDVIRIEENVQVWDYKWSELSDSLKERLKALIQQKLSLNFDSTMVDIQWRS